MTVKRPRPVTLFSDGSVYNNGQKGCQEAFYAVFLDDGTEEGKLLFHEDIGDASVNEAEYRGVIAALRWISDNDIDEQVIIITDSKLVWGHVLDDWRCAPFDKEGNPSKLLAFRDIVRVLLEVTDSRLIWKRRDRNMAGWFFEKEVDRRRKEKYANKKERKRSKRKTVRRWTLSFPDLSGYSGNRAASTSADDAIAVGTTDRHG